MDGQTISVIIPKCMDVTYMKRCISAIQRQTYKELEIIVVLDRMQSANHLDVKSDFFEAVEIVETDGEYLYSGANDAIDRARGEWIFFCDVNSVPAPNTLELLLGQCENMKSVFSWGNCYIPSKNNEYKKFENMELTWNGKLFLKELLMRTSQRVRENSVLAEYLFLAEYLSAYREEMAVAYCEQTYQYFPNAENLNRWMYETITIDDWNKAFLTLAHLDNRHLCHTLASALQKVIQTNRIESEDVMILAETVVHSMYEVNYALAKPVISQWWSDICEYRALDKIEKLRNYLSKYEGEPEFLDLLLHICGLNFRLYSYLKYEDSESALFMIDEFRKYSEKNMVLEQALMPIREELASIKQYYSMVQKELHLEINVGKNEEQILKGIQPGLARIGKTWFYFNHGEIDRSYVGLVQNTYGWWYIENGTINYHFSGLASNTYGIWYVRNGRIDETANGHLEVGGKEGFFKNGKLQVSFSGWRQSADGGCLYLNGLRDRAISGLRKIDGKWLYLEQGKLNREYRGLAKNPYGEWYVENGTINFQYSGKIWTVYGWRVVERGKVKKSIEIEGSMVEAGEE